MDTCKPTGVCVATETQLAVIRKAKAVPIAVIVKTGSSVALTVCFNSLARSQVKLPERQQYACFRRRGCGVWSRES